MQYGRRRHASTPPAPAPRPLPRERRAAAPPPPLREEEDTNSSIDSAMMSPLPLSPSSSISSLPPLSTPQSSRKASGSIPGSDTTVVPTAAQPQEPPSTSMGELGGAPAVMAPTSSPSSRLRRASPPSFQPLENRGNFRPLVRGSAGWRHAVAATYLFACLLSTASAARQRTHRNLEDEGWTGEWNGEWTANENEDGTSYSCGDNCNDDYYSTGDSIETELDIFGLGPEQIITYVSVGILSFMTLLCCLCYPEILVVGCTKMCGYCSRAKGETGVSGGGTGEENLESGYVGGMQNGEEKRKKKRMKSPKTMDVELV
ncbi:hypothetical protein ACHAWF_011149 [Thalassiosira exigua]